MIDRLLGKTAQFRELYVYDYSVVRSITFTDRVLVRGWFYPPAGSRPVEPQYAKMYNIAEINDDPKRIIRDLDKERSNHPKISPPENLNRWLESQCKPKIALPGDEDTDADR